MAGPFACLPMSLMVTPCCEMTRKIMHPGDRVYCGEIGYLPAEDLSSFQIPFARCLLRTTCGAISLAGCDRLIDDDILVDAVLA